MSPFCTTILVALRLGCGFRATRRKKLRLRSDLTNLSVPEIYFSGRRPECVSPPDLNRKRVRTRRGDDIASVERELAKLIERAIREGGFGELWVDGSRPTEGKHVFGSVQSLAAASRESFDPTAYDMVIVDEFHHAAAPTYRRLLEQVSPQYLLGLTATPERSDGLDILEYFGGRVAAELRLWTALEQQLLCPFLYYGVSDETDLSSLQWKRGGYDTESSRTF